MKSSCPYYKTFEETAELIITSVIEHLFCTSRSSKGFPNINALYPHGNSMR